MSSDQLQTPVIMVIFNRPDKTRQVFSAVAAMRPSRLLVIADGARANRAGEADLCRETREVVEAVNWPCEVSHNFSEVNLGCHPRVISGLDWAFEQIDEAIIVEDDCVPDPSFFRFCAEMLERFRGDDRIAGVSGTTFAQDLIRSPDSYYFALLPAIWGWATWRRQWQRYDRRMLGWPEQKKAGYLREILDAEGAGYWENVFDDVVSKGEQGAWDYRWIYTQLFSHRLTIMPSVNMVRNVGFGPDATHTVNRDNRLEPTRHAMPFPLLHPSAMVRSRQLDLAYQRRLKNTLIRKLVLRLRLAGARVLGPAFFGYPA